MQLFYPLGLPSDNIGIDGFHDTIKNQSQSYITITGCVLSHILSNNKLSSLEKMYYLLADSLSYINSSKGRNRSVSLPATNWAARLSYSKSEIFILQKSLEDKGYFIIYRDKNDKGQNNRNTITTTIPDHVFNDLKYEPDRFNLSFDGDIEDKANDYSKSGNLDSRDKTFIPTLEGKRQHLEKTKMFIRVPYRFLKELNSNCSISATAKVVLLYLFTKIYKSAVSKYNHECSGIRGDYDNSLDDLTHNSSSIVISYQELQQELKLHRNNISKVLKTLEEAKLIKRDQIVIKSDDDYNSRADKSLWRISLVNELYAINQSILHGQKDKEGHEVQIGYGEPEKQFDKTQSVISTTNTIINTYDQEIDAGVNQALESLEYKGCTKYDPPCTDSGQLYNKDFIVNKSIIKNIDYIDAKAEEELFEDNLCLSSSESYNNSSFLNDSCKKNQLRQTVEQEATIAKSTNKGTLAKAVQQQAQHKERTEYRKSYPTSDKSRELELRHFYPLPERDISILNSRANREFSNNFVNQLLLKLYIKYPEKRFKNKFTFLSYMTQILANEKHQGPLVNHTNFRFSCNVDATEKNSLKYEKYLSEIENSFDLSKTIQLKKKIAGIFSTEVAYKILTNVEFRTNNDNSFILALIPSHLDLSERQTEILSHQLEAVYGINGYYVQELEEDAIQPPQSRTTDIEANRKSIRNSDSSKDLDTIAEEIIENTEAIAEDTVWNQIRKGLREELGNHIDQVWFAKAEVKECTETNTITITMPTRFMADWVRNKYSHVIRRLAVWQGVKSVVYNYV